MEAPELSPLHSRPFTPAPSSPAIHARPFIPGPPSCGPGLGCLSAWPGGSSPAAVRPPVRPGARPSGRPPAPSLLPPPGRPAVRPATLIEPRGPSPEGQPPAADPGRARVGRAAAPPQDTGEKGRLRRPDPRGGASDGGSSSPGPNTRPPGPKGGALVPVRQAGAPGAPPQLLSGGLSARAPSRLPSSRLSAGCPPLRPSSRSQVFFGKFFSLRSQLFSSFF